MKSCRTDHRNDIGKCFRYVFFIFRPSLVFSRKKEIGVAVMYNNVTEAADEAMDDIACENFQKRIASMINEQEDFHDSCR